MRWRFFLLLSWLGASTSEDEGSCKAQIGCVAELDSASTARSLLNVAARKEILKQRLMEKDSGQANQDLIFTNWSLMNWTDASDAAQNLVFTNWSLENLSDQIFAIVGKEAQPPAKIANDVDENGEIKGGPMHTFVRAQCHQPVFAPDGNCPRSCPFFAEEMDKSCVFRCVKASECGNSNPEHRVADEDGLYCRACKVEGCKACAAGQVDACAECNVGYITHPDGTCVSKFAIAWKWFFSITGIIVFVLLLWFLHIAFAPVTNAEGLQEALAFRSSLKLHVPRNAEVQVFGNRDAKTDSGRQLWPLDTSLHREKVGGVGLALHMNFQMYNIIWACLLVVVWLIFVFWTDSRQLSLGLEPLMREPQHLCVATVEGKNLFNANLHWKVVFLIIIYLLTFTGSIAYTFVQQYFFDITQDDPSMDDYAAIVTGLPPLPGDRKWEERLQEAIQTASKQQVVGVSICWNFDKVANEVEQILELDTLSREKTERRDPLAPQSGTSTGSAQVYNLSPRTMDKDPLLQLRVHEGPGRAEQEIAHLQQERTRQIQEMQEQQSRGLSDSEREALESRMQRFQEAAKDSQVAERVVAFEKASSSRGGSPTQLTPRGGQSPTAQSPVLPSRSPVVLDSAPLTPSRPVPSSARASSPLADQQTTQSPGTARSAGAEIEQAFADAHRSLLFGKHLRTGCSGKVDSLVMGFFGFGSANKPPKEVSEDGVRAMLMRMESTSSAFVVFETEEARDSAVKEMKSGVAFQGGLLTFEKAIAMEPNTVQWQAYALTSFTFVTRFVLGFLIMITAAIIWAACFYLPYAYFNSMFSYQSGEEPGTVETIVFSMVVTIGNQVMYQICAAIATWNGYSTRDGVEGAFVALYFCAITLQVLLDLIVEGYIGWVAMLAKGTHTADGRLLSELTSFEDIFQSYPVQVVLGKRLFAYCFPGTFLLPFLVEPLGAVFLPYYICKLLVRTHPEVRGREAEKALMFFTPYDMGRYGDILLNFMLAVLVFFFPSGLILKLFLVYIVSHIWIYFYDRYKILRSVPAFCYASYYMEHQVQILLAIPCATLAAGIVFKGNCVHSVMCFEGMLGVAVVTAFWCHLLLHWTALLVATRLAKRMHTHRVHKTPYSEVASTCATNWFNSNPIHCLRSKYFYKHSPPCDYLIQGKEHLIRKNPQIGMYYEDQTKTVVEDYSMHLFMGAEVVQA